MFATRHEVNGFLSAGPLNLTVEEQEGFKRQLMNWPFPFHLFLVSVRTQLTFSATHQISRNPPARLCALPSQPKHERGSSKLVFISPTYVFPSAWISFISLVPANKGKGAHKQTVTYHFPKGSRAVLLENRFLFCRESDVQVLVCGC